MDNKLFKSKLISITLKCIDELPSNWNTTNTHINTYIIEGLDFRLRNKFTLKEDELPILECVLSDSFLLITSRRIISSYNGKIEEIEVKKIVGFDNEYERQNYKKDNGRLPPTHLMVLKGEDNKKLFFEVDSIHPAYFTKILIMNLFTYSRYGTWYLNPSKDWRKKA